jgi:hypothetical protein
LAELRMPPYDVGRAPRSQPVRPGCEFRVAGAVTYCNGEDMSDRREHAEMEPSPRRAAPIDAHVEV